MRTIVQVLNGTISAVLGPRYTYDIVKLIKRQVFGRGFGNFELRIREVSCSVLEEEDISGITPLGVSHCYMRNR